MVESVEFDASCTIDSAGKYELSNIRILIPDDKISEFVSHLSMLEKELIVAIIVNDHSKNNRRVQIMYPNKIKWSIGSLVDGIYHIKLGKDAFEYVMYFLLRYLRDGISDSDHVDVEFDLLKPLYCRHDCSPDLTILIPDENVRVHIGEHRKIISSIRDTN